MDDRMIQAVREAQSSCPLVQRPDANRLPRGRVDGVPDQVVTMGFSLGSCLHDVQQAIAPHECVVHVPRPKGQMQRLGGAGIGIQQVQRPMMAFAQVEAVVRHTSWTLNPEVEAVLSCEMGRHPGHASG